MSKKTWGGILTLCVLAACSSARRGGGGGGGGSGDDAGIMLASCTPGMPTCVGDEVHACRADGTPDPTVMSTCDSAAGSVCSNGACVEGCAAALTTASNIGCEFWAVQLDNEEVAGSLAASQPWGIVVSNAGMATAMVTVDENTGPPGGATQTSNVMGFSLAPGTAQMVALPQRWIDGSTGMENNGPGTDLTSNAYRVTSTVPLVVYQFNPLRQSYSNDASLLIPTNGLGLDHRIVGYPTGRPIDSLGELASHSYITIVGTQAATTVTVKVTNATVAGPGIPALAAGATWTGTIGAFDVVNIESSGAPGDFTGSAVSATLPVAVFSGSEASVAPATATKPPPPPGFDTSSTICCTDHLEEQVWPVTSLGKTFVITRSPIRSDDPATYPGYDIVRFVGAADVATVTTNLAGADASFTLQPGELHEAFVDRDFVATATAPILVAQILVSGDYTDTDALVGDPSLTIFPAREQFRSSYLFLVPESYDTNYLVIAQPATDAAVQIDGAALPSTCTSADAGTVAGIDYVSRTCPVVAGSHNLTAANPFGIAAYGYYRYGSYAFIGGANVEKIYMPPPII